MSLRLAYLLLALAFFGCAHEAAMATPTNMPKQPDFESDGFRLEVSRGCEDALQCSVLRSRAYARLSRCTQAWAAYVRQATARGYVFEQVPTCPVHVREDVTIAKRLSAVFVKPNTPGSSWIAYR